MNSSYYIVTLRIDAGLEDEQTGLFAGVFEEYALSFSCRKDKGVWDFLWTFRDAPDEEELKRRFGIIAEMTDIAAHLFNAYKIEELQDRDWLAESYRALPAFTVGPFYIYGSHCTDTVPSGKIPMLIEAATAFGSGEHGTTSCCMLALDYLREEGLNPPLILDMGCGSGILAIASAKLWPNAMVLAADNDPECVRVTDIHKTANNAVHIETFRSEGYEPQSPVWEKAPYDLVIANILAGPLIDMAPEQSRAVANNGYLILSGTLAEQGDAVQAAYTPHGFKHVKTFPGNEWVTLLLQKSAA